MTLTYDQHAKARRLGLTDEAYEQRLASWYARQADRPRLLAEKAQRAAEREARQGERIQRAAEEARRAAERARQHEANLAERAAARSAAAKKAREVAETKRLKQGKADELERLRIKCDDGRTWDPTTGVTIERSTGLPVVRTTYAFGFQYSANPVTGKPWSEVQVSKQENNKQKG